MNEHERLEDKLNLLQFSIDAIPDAVYWITMDGRIWDVNTAACGMFGYSREELLSLSVHNIDPEYSLEEGQADLEELKRTGILYLKRCHTAKDGRVILVEITSNYFSCNDVEYICCIVRDITERVKAEKEAYFFKTLVEQTRDPIHVISHTRGARLIYVNEAACLHFGREREELLTMRIPDVDPTVDMDRLSEMHEELKGKMALRHETVHRRVSGETIPVEVTCNYLDLDGEELVVGYFHDISRRKSMKAAVRQAHEELEKRIEERTVDLRNANELLKQEVNLRKRTESVIRARLRLLQFAATHTLDELLEATLNEAEALTGSLIGFFHFLEADEKTLSLRNWSSRTKTEFCRAEGKGSHYDVAAAGVWGDCIRERRPVVHNDYASLPHRKGLPPGHAPVDRELVVPVIRGNRIVAILGVGNKPGAYNNEDVEAVSFLADFVWDITERMQAEEALRKSRQMLRIVLDNFPGVVFWKDLNSLYLGCNRNFSLAAGLAEPWEIVGRNDYELPWKNDAERYLEDDRQVLRSGVPKLNIIEPLLCADGRVAWLETSKVPLFDADGKVFAVLGVSNDITERKRAEEALQKAHDELEFRVRERTEQLTSLTAELSLAEEQERRRIATNLHDQVGQTLILSKMKLDSLSASLPSESFEKLVGEVRECLHQSIEEIRSLTFQLSPPLLYEVGFEAAMEWLGEEFEEKYGFQVEFKDDGKTKRLDEETSVALYQMVRELLVNVAKHAKAKRVRISIEKVSNQTRVSVEDDGIGFDAINGMGRKKRKRGFGLFNIRQRIDYMGGNLEIESRIGQGTRATLFLPLRKKKEASADRRKP